MLICDTVIGIGVHTNIFTPPSQNKSVSLELLQTKEKNTFSRKTTLASETDKNNHGNAF